MIKRKVLKKQNLVYFCVKRVCDAQIVIIRSGQNQVLFRITPRDRIYLENEHVQALNRIEMKHFHIHNQNERPICC